MTDPSPRKFQRRTTQRTPVREELYGRIWYIKPQETTGTCLTLPTLPELEFGERIAVIKSAVFGENLAGLVNSMPHVSEKYPSKLLAYYDEDAWLTPCFISNLLGDWLAYNVFGFNITSPPLRGTLILSGAGGLGLSTSQLESLAILTKLYPQQLQPGAEIGLLSSF